MADRADPSALRDRTFERILLIKPSSLGDLVHALPVLHALRTRFPDAEIHWLVGKSFAPLIAGHPDLDEVVEFDRKRFSRVGTGFKPSVEFIEFVQCLRAKHYDLVVDLQGLFRSGFFSFASGAPTRVGFASARELAWMFYTHKIPTPDTEEHAAEKNDRIARALGCGEGPLVFNLAVTETERNEATALLDGADAPTDSPFCTVWPGARWDTKRWFADRFSALIDEITTQAELPVVVMGDPSEAELCAQVAGGCRRRPAVLAGQTSIRQAVAVLERSALVVTHDSAPMHLAAALNRPLVAILGPTNPRRTGPYGMPQSVLRIDLDCAPCYLKRLSQCPYDHRCMRDIGVSDVMRHIEAIQVTTKPATYR